MTKEEKKMQENKAIIDLTLEEALMGLSRTLYDRNADMRVIMARQDLISVITRKTQYLQDLLEILKKAFKSNSIYLINLKSSVESERITQNEFNVIREWLNK